LKISLETRQFAGRHRNQVGQFSSFCYLEPQTTLYVEMMKNILMMSQFIYLFIFLCGALGAGGALLLDDDY